MSAAAVAPDQERLRQERDAIETILNVRANFSMVVFGLVVAAVANIDLKWSQSAILFLGAVLSWMLALATSRAQYKLDLILCQMEAVKALDTLADESVTTAPRLLRWAVGKSRRRWIGYGIPWFTTLVLVVGTAVAACGWLRFSAPNDASIAVRLDSLIVVNAVQSRELVTLRSECLLTRLALESLREQR